MSKYAQMCAAKKNIRNIIERFQKINDHVYEIDMSIIRAFTDQKYSLLYYVNSRCESLGNLEMTRFLFQTYSGNN